MQLGEAVIAGGKKHGRLNAANSEWPSTEAQWDSPVKWLYEVMMHDKIEIYVGGTPAHESELHFLRRLSRDLEQSKLEAIIFCNFYAGSKNQELDFLVIVPACGVWLVELKSIDAPVKGDANGSSWEVKGADGTWKRIPTLGNPYQQARKGKYEVGRDMEVFAKSTRLAGMHAEYYKQMIACACFYPSLHEESSVPSDYTASVLSYDKLYEQIVSGQGKTPNWTAGDWRALAGFKNLERYHLKSNSTQVYPVVESYLASLREELEHDVVELLPTTASVDGATHPSTWILDGHNLRSNLAIIGGAGMGKSLITRKLAIKALDAGLIPLYVKAKEYEGNWNALLDACVRHLTREPFASFARAVELCDRHFYLVIDGLNELSNDLQDRLSKDLRHWYLNYELGTVVISSQIDSPLVSTLKCLTTRICPLSDPERFAIYSHYAKVDITDPRVTIARAFNNVFELKLLASLEGRFTNRPDRRTLYETYLRERCVELTGNAVYLSLARQCYQALAKWMSDKYRNVIPAIEAENVIAEVFRSRKESTSNAQHLLMIGPIAGNRDGYQFSHELWKLYYDAINLHETCKDPSVLAGEELRRPVHRKVLPFYLELETDRGRLEHALRIIADCCEVVAFDFVVNQLKSGRSQITQLIAKRLIVQAMKEFAECSISLCDSLNRSQERTPSIKLSLIPPIRFQSRHSVRLSNYACVMWRAILQCAKCEAVANELQKMEELVDMRIDGCIRDRLWKDETTSRAAINAINAYLDRSCHDQFDARPNHWPQYGKGNFGAGCPVAAMIAKGYTSYNVPETTCDTLQSSNISVASPPPTADEIQKMAGLYQSCLQNHDLCDIRQVVDAWNLMLYEDEGAWTALKALDRGSQIELLLKTLNELPGPLAVHIAHWLHLDDEENVSLPVITRVVSDIEYYYTEYDDAPWSSALTYLDSWETMSRLLESPLSLPTEDISNRDKAWWYYGHIAFWLSKDGPNKDDCPRQCELTWMALRKECPFDAVDVLWRFATNLGGCDAEDGFTYPSLDRMLTRCKDQIRLLLEFGLRNRTQLPVIDEDSSTNMYSKYPQDELHRARFIVHTLGKTGDADSVSVLEDVLEDQDIGELAHSAILAINNRIR